MWIRLDDRTKTSRLLPEMPQRARVFLCPIEICCRLVKVVAADIVDFEVNEDFGLYVLDYGNLVMTYPSIQPYYGFKKYAYNAILTHTKVPPDQGARPSFGKFARILLGLFRPGF